MSDSSEASPKSRVNRTTGTLMDENIGPLDKMAENEFEEHEAQPDSPRTGSPDQLDGNNFFDLKPPIPVLNDLTKIEEVMKRLYSEEHLHYILSDHAQYQRFSSFLSRYKPLMVPTLVRYMEMRKAMKAIEYANAVARTIKWPSQSDYSKFSRIEAAQTDGRFEDYASREVNSLLAEALPAWVTYLLVGVVADCLAREITGQSLPVVKDLVGNLGEVFCLTDPKIRDNPIIYCSEEFYRTTQYGTNFAINRNCRFLQGPHTNEATKDRLRKAISLGQESNEVLLNYRRDGTPFANLLMVSPLYDDKGNVRYFIGAQIDVTGLILDGLGLDSFRGMLYKSVPQISTAPSENLDNSNHDVRPSISAQSNYNKVCDPLDKLTDLSLMLSLDESEVVTKNILSGAPHHLDTESITSDGCSIRSMLPTNKMARQNRRIIDAHDSDIHMGQSAAEGNNAAINRAFLGAYRHYLLVRPYPSLQIIFASPTLRLPGLLRTPLFTKIGGSPTVLSSLEDAFRDGASVTARILWLPKHGYPANSKARRRWIRCTPLLGSDERVGVWMIVLVPADGDEDINRSMTDSGYHSIGGLGSIMGMGNFGNGRISSFNSTIDEFDDLAAMESLVEGRRSSALEISGHAPRSRRVTIMDHENPTQGPSDNIYGMTSPERQFRNLAKRGIDDGLYAQFLRNSASTNSIIEEEI
ncbi:BgTH12-05061 [Blumeria graminis f. sp. triticale]|nr:BgTH12-05061 [Blumeria graminis f. sp. triticale]